MDKLTFDAFAARYCERQEQTPEGLLEIFRKQAVLYNPTGWFMLECHMMGSSRMGELTIVAFGPQNTFKEIPTHPVSPRGLASDTAVAMAWLAKTDLPESKG